jgi:hypothetical protein
MHAADAPGRKHAYAGHLGNNHGSRDRGRAGQPAREHEREIAPAALDDTGSCLAESLDLVGREAGLQVAFNDADRRRYRAGIAHRGFDGHRGFDISGVGHAVADDGRFERHHGVAGGEGRSDLGCDLQVLFNCCAWHGQTP